MKHSLRAERLRVEELARRVRADRAAVERQGGMLRERVGERLATPAGVLACFAAGALLVPLAGSLIRGLVSAGGLGTLALRSAQLYRTVGGKPGATPDSGAQRTRS